MSQSANQPPLVALLALTALLASAVAAADTAGDGKRVLSRHGDKEWVLLEGAPAGLPPGSKELALMQGQRKLERYDLSKPESCEVLTPFTGRDTQPVTAKTFLISQGLCKPGHVRTGYMVYVPKQLYTKLVRKARVRGLPPGPDGKPKGELVAGEMVYFQQWIANVGIVKNGVFDGTMIHRGKPYYIGKWKEGRPVGKALCEHDGHLEPCEHDAQGKRVDAIYLARTEQQREQKCSTNLRALNQAESEIRDVLRNSCDQYLRDAYDLVENGWRGRGSYSRNYVTDRGPFDWLAGCGDDFSKLTGKILESSESNVKQIQADRCISDDQFSRLKEARENLLAESKRLTSAYNAQAEQLREEYQNNAAARSRAKAAEDRAQFQAMIDGIQRAGQEALAVRQRQYDLDMQRLAMSTQNEPHRQHDSGRQHPDAQRATPSTGVAATANPARAPTTAPAKPSWIDRAREECRQGGHTWDAAKNTCHAVYHINVPGWGCADGGSGACAKYNAGNSTASTGSQGASGASSTSGAGATGAGGARQTASASGAKAQGKEALAYCWQTGNGNYYCDGRIQETTTGEKDVNVQLKHVGCENPRKQRPFADGTLYYCGYPLEAGNTGQLTWNRDIRHWRGINE